MSSGKLHILIIHLRLAAPIRLPQAPLHQAPAEQLAQRRAGVHRHVALPQVAAQQALAAGAHLAD